MRSVKEGTSAVLLQSGLRNEWWADSVECYRYLRNIQDLLSDGKTPYEKRFGMPFHGPVTPFGAMVEYHPISAKDQSRLHQFGVKILPGIFLGYGRRHLRIGGDGRTWTSRPKAQCKGSVNVAKKWKLHILCSRWYSKNLGERTASENIHLDPGAFGTRRRTRNSSRKVRWIRCFNPTSRRLDARWWGS